MSVKDIKLSLHELTFEDLESILDNEDTVSESKPILGNGISKIKDKSKIYSSDTLTESKPILGDGITRFESKIGKYNERYGFTLVDIYGILNDGKNPIVFSCVNWGSFLNKRYDLRHWNSDMSIPHKGLTFDENELRTILQYPVEESILSKNEEIVAEYSQGKSKATIYRNIVLLNMQRLHRAVWKKEINLVDWGKGIKFDFRQWDERYKKCGKGICLSLDEYQLFYKLLQKLFI